MTPSQIVEPTASAPEGTIVTEINGDIYFHYAATEEAFGIIGLEITGLTFTCSDPITLFAYPFTMGSSREDPVYCAGQYLGDAYTRTGSISLWGASWGTLALPYGSFDNVLMVQMVVDFEETVENDPQSPYYYQALTQMFLKPGLRAPMLIGQQAATGSSAQMLHENSIGIHEALRNSIGLELFPNPAHDRVELVFGIGGGSNIQIALIDITGRQVFSKRLSTVSSGAHREMLDLNGIPAGTYLMRISDERGASGVQRLVVDRSGRQ
jgi:hypothetical protein